MNLGARSRSSQFEDPQFHNLFENFQSNFNLNEYNDDLNNDSSQSQQRFFYDLDDNQMQLDDQHNINGDVFGKVEQFLVNEGRLKFNGEINKESLKAKGSIKNIELLIPIYDPCASK
ncbi:MAG: hypothetical protein EZS28_025104 [Streblomastix strix]|uniref:Uncharacterized protein n=1 Tax=Streblomastix strix TaxID=222440 RepID=A0A5J4V9X0_9EUKA|nr:MAG: hypothetical protein EZS28_025104 [Streblomastix strix]